MTKTKTRDHAAEYAATIAEEVAQVEAVLAGDADADTLAGFDPDEYACPFHWYLDQMLDIEVLRSDENPERVRIELTRTVGGPGCWIIYDSGDSDTVVELRAVWGSGGATDFVRAPSLCAHLRDLYEVPS